MARKATRSEEPARHSLSELEAFDAMRIFLEAFWRREGCESDEIRDLVSWMDRIGAQSGKQAKRSDESLPDIAQWEDWLDAIEAMKATRQA